MIVASQVLLLLKLLHLGRAAGGGVVGGGVTYPPPPPQIQNKTIKKDSVDFLSPFNHELVWLTLKSYQWCSY
jgi:hypothetical protein